jgi:putative ABC transport system permease protein
MKSFGFDSPTELPAVAGVILRILLRDGDYEDLIGYYRNGYLDVYSSQGPKEARFWLWSQIHRALPALMRMKVLGEMIMFNNYLKTAVRNILRHKVYSLINISGLAIGFTCCLLIFFWVHHEWSCDRHHVQADNIHQVVIQWLEGDRTRWARVTPPPLAAALKSEFPEVKESALFGTQDRILVEHEETRYMEKIGFASPELFSIFTIPLRNGDPLAALMDPSSLILDEKTAKKYFGTENPLGKSLVLNHKHTFQVAGIMRNIPENSVIHCPLLVSFRQMQVLFDRGRMDNWGEYGFRTFVLLQDGSDFRALCARLDGYLEEKHEEDNIRLSLQPLTRIHLYALEGGGPILYIYIFMAVAVFMLLIACVNFINLTTARAANRIREIGVRKVVGADRRKLVLQFLGESIFMALVSSILALILAWMLLAPLKQMAGIPAGGELPSPMIIPSFLAVAFMTGFLAGIYPAFVLSSFRPAGMLRSRQNTGSPVLRKILVVFQFSIAISLLICMTLISRQIDYLSRKPLGFDKDQVVYFPLNPELVNQYDPLRHELLAHRHVISLTGTSNYLGRSPIWSTETLDWEGKDPNNKFNLYMISVDSEFAETFRIEMAEGRFYTQEYETDQRNFILNETAVKDMGLASPLGKEFQIHEIRGRIIGIVKDFHFRPLHREVQPLALILNRDWHNFMAVKISPTDVPETLAHIEKVFKKLSPPYPFEYHFLDETLDRMYKRESRSRSLFRYFVFLAGFISCFGLFGLASFMVEKRTKEIGVRKVLGASASGIAVMLSREFLLWVLIANLISWPMAYIIIEKWLENFAYRAAVRIDVFLYSGLSALLVALITVSFQTLRAAMSDPIETLRYE